jgi:hypothetical protein
VGEEVERLEDHADVGAEAASALPSAGRTLPSTVISPSSMVSSRLMARHSVDFPDPRADDDDDLAAGDLKVDVLEDVKRAEVLVDLLQGDQRVRRRRGSGRLRVTCHEKNLANDRPLAIQARPKGGIVIQEQPKPELRADG